MPRQFLRRLSAQPPSRAKQLEAIAGAAPKPALRQMKDKDSFCLGDGIFGIHMLYGGKTMAGLAMNRMIKPLANATYEDVLAAPPHMVAELIYGVLHTQPRPAMPHALAGSNLGSEINPAFQKGRGGPGGWWIIDEPEVHLGEQVLVPDIAGWRRETMPDYPETAFVTTVPDWVCEVLSPSTREFDLTDKREIYGDYGVKHIWFVDPDARTLEAFEHKEGAWVLIAALRGEADVAVAPFDAISFSLSDLWPPQQRSDS